MFHNFEVPPFSSLAFSATPYASTNDQWARPGSVQLRHFVRAFKRSADKQ